MEEWSDNLNSLKGIHCKAEYNEQIIEEHKGNPFIEAIPSRVEVEDFYELLFSVPSFKDEYLELGVEDRLSLVQQIKPMFWLPFPGHYDKYRALYNMIKIGYQSRNPLLPMYNRQFAVGWDRIFETGLDQSGANLAGNIQTAQSHAEIGLSGMGKSKIYERILKTLFPQVIHHSQYNGKQLLMKQVTWLKIECPSGKSIGALTRNFYVAVDELLGTNYYEKFGEKGGTIDNLTKRMVKVAAQINLGVLIIDEIQNVHKAHSGGDERIINFITELVNTIGIPVIIIGTFKAMYLFEKSLANSRRAVSDMYLENITSFLEENSWEWNEFIENLWDQQYTIKYTPITAEIKHTMYILTLGIPDVAVKLFIHVQAKAILNGADEKISVSLINEVASKSLSILQRIFHKILSNYDPSYLEELEDIQPEWISFDEYYKKAKQSSLNLYKKRQNANTRAINQKSEGSILEELITFASNLINETEMAESLAKSVFDTSKKNGDKQSMFKQIAELAIGLGEKNSQNLNESLDIRKRVAKNPKPKLEEVDIRFIVKQGETRSLTAEESLIEAGIVKDCNELLNYVN
ncbi:AAA family ATPase [Falsibacillus pallidus]|uniref:TniB protein n=1 Tax=Falsibacillus pallidus TaxID=493781 RepID=A0A370G4L3_9BACI|nr:TniB family NTP-binding protein [Falsibacillus pallidus]RDI37524.1 TniB protein [Falsibacillus pallidus]